MTILSVNTLKICPMGIAGANIGTRSPCLPYLLYTRTETAKMFQKRSLLCMRLRLTFGGIIFWIGGRFDTAIQDGCRPPYWIR